MLAGVSRRIIIIVAKQAAKFWKGPLCRTTMRVGLTVTCRVLTEACLDLYLFDKKLEV